MQDNQPHDDDEASLEKTEVTPIAQPVAPVAPPKNRRRLIIMAVGGVLLIGIITGGAALTLKKPAKPAAKPTPTPVVINTQTLDNGTLNKVNSQVNAANPAGTSQQLTISPDTLFKRSVDIQGDVKAANNLDVNGNTAIHGALSVGGLLSAPSLNVGSLAITTANVSGALNVGGHIVPSGTQPAIKSSLGAAGATIAISGNDTAGTITITTTGGNQIAGEMVIVTFKNAFSGTPKVQLTPVNGASASLDYFATRSSSFFTVNSSSVPSTNTTYTFDYLVTQ